jgi:hypothetical protein
MSDDLSAIEQTLLSAMRLVTMHSAGAAARLWGYPAPSREQTEQIDQLSRRVCADMIKSLRGAPAANPAELDLACAEVAGACLLAVMGEPRGQAAELLS